MENVLLYRWVGVVLISYDVSCSKGEHEWDENEDIAMIMLIGMEKNKWPKQGGAIVSREVICKRVDNHNRLMHSRVEVQLG